MASALFIRLDDTLLDGDGNARPYAAKAVRALAGFRDDQGDAVAIALLAGASTHDGPAPRASGAEPAAQDAAAIFRVAVLPTRSTVAHYPSRGFFDEALARLEVAAPLRSCAIVCHDAAETEACRALGLETFRYDGGDGSGDFGDWAEAPLLLARRLGTDNDANLERALTVTLEQRADIESCHIESRNPDGRLSLRARRWCPIVAPELGDLDGVRVPLPVRVEVALDDRAGLADVEAGVPDPALVAEARLYIANLDRAGRIAGTGLALPRGATHRLAIDDQGHRRLERRRTSPF